MLTNFPGRNGTSGCTYVKGLGQEDPAEKIEALKRALNAYERNSWGLPDLKLNEQRLSRQVELARAIARDMLQGSWNLAPMSAEAQKASQLLDNFAGALDRLRGRYWLQIETAEKAMRDGLADYELAKKELAAAVHTEGLEGLGVIQWALVTKLAGYAILAFSAYVLWDLISKNMQRATDASDKSEILAVAEKKAAAGDKSGIAQMVLDLDRLGVPASAIDMYAADIFGKDPTLIRQAKLAAQKKAAELGAGGLNLTTIAGTAIVVLGAFLLLPRLLNRD